MVISAEALTHAATRVAILLPPGPNIGRLVAANGSRGEGGPFAAIRSQIDAQSHQGDALILRTRSERNGVCYGTEVPQGTPRFESLQEGKEIA